VDVLYFVAAAPDLARYVCTLPLTAWILGWTRMIYDSKWRAQGNDRPETETGSVRMHNAQCTTEMA